LDHGRLPSDLAGLVPDYLAALPADSFAPSGQPFHYQLAGDHYKLWSVGYDGVDDNGLPSRNEQGWPDLSCKGDLQLADFYAPDDSQKAGPSDKR
jgi:hypothetical protein